MPRRRALRVLAAVAGVLALAVVGVLGVAISAIRRPIPDHSGSVDLPGLSADVTVLRDAQGVPSIYADTADDLFRAQGYVHAQDRFFEMDYRRHVTSGRLSELVGQSEDALASDKVVRTLGWREVAEQEWELLSAETRGYLEAYADGVNAYLDTRSPDSLGVEYTVLGMSVDVAQPEPWDPIDSLAWLKAMAWEMNTNYGDELGRSLAYSTIHDVEQVDDLFPSFPQDVNMPIVQAASPAQGTDAGSGSSATVGAGVSVVADSDVVLPGIGRQLESVLAATLEALDAVPHLLGEGNDVGSSSWVVSGDLTLNGAPVLANDPHAVISAPGVWMQMGLYCTQVSPECPFVVSGFTYSGFPGVVIGHNADLAWGLTSLGADVTDFFLERVNDDDASYLRDGEQEPLEVRTETIKVNGADPVSLTVQSTAHGPLVTDVLGLEEVTFAPTGTGRRANTEVALAWTGLQPGRTADAIFLLDTASDPDDIAEAASTFEAPSQSIIYGTVDGHIGYQASGRVPTRGQVTDGPVASDGTWPRPGWDSRYDWTGWVDPGAMPAVQDPAEGYIVAANQAATPAGTGPFLTSDWDYGYRSQRIRNLLDDAIAAGTPIDVATMQRIQTDTWNPYAAALVPALLDVGGANDFTQEGIDLLREWDFQQTADSAAAAYFAAVWDTLLQLTFSDDLPEAMWPDGGSQWLAVVVSLLDKPSSTWWDDRRTVNVVESRDEILARALETARLELTVELGKNARDWEWGRLHTVAPQHILLGGDDTAGPVQRLMNPSPFAVSGGSSTINATEWDAASGSFAVTTGPSVRMVVDLGDLDASTWVTLTGTSGHPGSPHYTDQLAAWAQGETFAWPFTPDAVQTSSDRELILHAASGP